MSDMSCDCIKYAMQCGNEREGETQVRKWHRAILSGEQGEQNEEEKMSELKIVHL